MPLNKETKPNQTKLSIESTMWDEKEQSKKEEKEKRDQDSIVYFIYYNVLCYYDNRISYNSELKPVCVTNLLYL